MRNSLLKTFKLIRHCVLCAMYSQCWTLEESVLGKQAIEFNENTDKLTLLITCEQTFIKLVVSTSIQSDPNKITAYFGKWGKLRAVSLTFNWLWSFWKRKNRPLENGDFQWRSYLSLWQYEETARHVIFESEPKEVTRETLWNLDY